MFNIILMRKNIHLAAKLILPDVDFGLQLTGLLF